MVVIVKRKSSLGSRVVAIDVPLRLPESCNKAHFLYLNVNKRVFWYAACWWSSLYSEAELEPSINGYISRRSNSKRALQEKWES